MPDGTITIRNLVEAFAEQQRHHNEFGSDEFGRYYDLKLSLLVDLFGCNLVAREAELEETWNEWSSRSGRDRYEIQPSSVGLFRDCITFLNQTETPFGGGILLEGSPSRIEREMQERFGQQLTAERQQLNRTVTDMAGAILMALFPGIESRRHTWDDLIALGLPRLAPDPLDYF